MSETENVYNGRVLVVAFEGWNDASEAATGAIEVLQEQLGVVPLLELDSEKYFDYQFSRPSIKEDDGQRRLVWPSAKLYGPAATCDESNQDSDNKFDTDTDSLENEYTFDPTATTNNIFDTNFALLNEFGTVGKNSDKIYLLLGQEPARCWKTFSCEIVDKAQELDIGIILFLGAMLSDVPHSRPINIFSISQNEAIRKQYDAEASTYEGPVGILSAIAERAEDVGIPTLMFWASIPHYVHNAPSPKAMLALIDKIEQFVDVTIPRGTLIKRPTEWEQSIDALAAGDDDMAAYIQQLEQVRDAANAPEASGEMIAQEFERYLRRRDDSAGGQPGGPDETHRG